MRRSLVLLLAVLVAVAAGCGGGGSSGPRLSKSEYEQRVGEVATTFTRTAVEIGRAVNGSASLKDTAPAIDKLAGALSKVADSFDALRPPKEIEAAHRRLVDGMRRFASDLRAAAVDARSGKIATVAELTLRLGGLASAKEISQATKELRDKGYSFTAKGS